MEWQYLFIDLFYFYVESHDLGIIKDNICDSETLQSISIIIKCYCSSVFVKTVKLNGKNN